ncbi:hypothetical protein GTW37_08425, partial [Streptomyces sp. SID4931]|nr:hypothetical protein [Streptomyces sp. SID4931]
MVYFAAFAVLLHRSTGRTDVVVGIPAAGRTRAEVRDVIGLFVNTVPLRADLSGNPDFADLLRQVRGATLKALSGQDVPLDVFVERLRPERDPQARNPLFGIIFSTEDGTPRPGAAPGLLADAEHEEVWTGTAKMDLTWTVRTGDEEPHLQIEYATSLYDAPTIELFAKRYLRLLEGLMAQPGTATADVPLLTREERSRGVRDLLPHPTTAASPPTGTATAPAPHVARDADAYKDVTLRLRELYAALLDLPETADGTPPVAASDSFFEVGGYSLLAVQLISRIKTELGAEIGIRDVFEASTPLA